MHILVLGGNGFIGYHFMKLLMSWVDRQDEKISLHITVLNRGKSWDWNKKCHVMGRVTSIKWNRDKPLSECTELQHLLSGIDQFHAVIDFSGYTKEHVKHSVKLLNQRTRVYIYISSDSVYEVCEKSHDGKTTESDDRRPTAKDEVKRLKRKDSYGHDKLNCEESIIKYCEGMKFVILRLADVIGPMDSTDRWWQYQLWVKLSMELSLPVYVPSELKGSEISLVYVKDVAKLIVDILIMAHDDINDVSQSPYNLACNEVVTVENLIRIIEKYLGEYYSNIQCLEHNARPEKPLSIQYSQSSDVPYIYPSVEKGPISIEKSLSKLNWKPTSLCEAVRETVAFYEDICAQENQYTHEKEDIYDSLLEDIEYLYDKCSFLHIKQNLQRMLGI